MANTRRTHIGAVAVSAAAAGILSFNEPLRQMTRDFI